MIDFVTYSQFESILTLRVLLGIGIVYLMYQFALRNPTDYDTPYRRKMRHVYGWICCAGAIGFIFLAVAGPFPYSLPWYYLSLYGTVSPSEDALLYGISSKMIIRASNAHCIWGRMTLEQWSMCSSISGILEWAALAVYAFAMKRSSVKWFAKIRKALGYILLIVLPAQVNNLHYFDAYELIPIAVYILAVYLLVRTYKFDNKEPKLPEEAEHMHIQDFRVEEPEDVAEVEESSNIVKTEEKDLGVTSKFYDRLKFFSNKTLRYVLLSFSILCFILSAIFAIFGYSAEISKDDDNTFKYYEDWGVYMQAPCLEHAYEHVDYNIGFPVHPKLSLYAKFYTRYGGEVHPTKYNQPMYVRFLNYIPRGYDGLTLFDFLKKQGYPVLLGRDIDGSHKYIIYWDEVGESFNYTFYGSTFYANCWHRKHIIEEKAGRIYEFIVYFADEEAYDGSIENIYSLESPLSSENRVSSATWMIWYYIFALMAIVAMIIFAIFSYKELREHANNIKAFKLLKYMGWCLVCEYVLHLVILLPNLPLSASDFEGLLGFLVVFVVYIGIVRIPLMIYVYKRLRQEDSKFYLVPQWMRDVINEYAESEAPIRAALVFLIYPLFYLCMFPGGVFAFCYLIPAIIVYIIVFFIIWVVNGIKSSNKYYE